MKIAIVGYGAMGKEIEASAKEKGIEVARVFDIGDELTGEGYNVAIEFTQPSAAVGNIEKLIKSGKNVVIGTTGWYDEIDHVKQLAETHDVGVVYGSNFSIGMNMLFRIAGYAASLADKFEDFDVMLHEMHHKRKKDSPSGSAETIAKILLEKLSRKKSIGVETMHEKINPEVLHVSSTRGGEITGRHTIYIDSVTDSIELSHRAKSRKGFAMGSIEAAKWINGKKGFYEFKDILDDVWR